MTILELREKRAKAWDAAKAFLDSHRTDKGTLSAEDDATYSRMEQDISDLGKEIARMERREALDAELNKPVNHPITGKPAGDQQPEKKGRASDEYKRNFWNAMRLQGNPYEIRNALQKALTARAATWCRTSMSAPWFRLWRRKTSSAAWPRLSRPPAVTARSPS